MALRLRKSRHARKKSKEGSKYSASGNSATAKLLRLRKRIPRFTKLKSKKGIQINNAKKPEEELGVGIYTLPNGWTKRITQRRSGFSKGHKDVYLQPPKRFNWKQLRSYRELEEFYRNFPDCQVDFHNVNFKLILADPRKGSDDVEEFLTPEVLRCCKTAESTWDYLWNVCQSVPSSLNILKMELPEDH